MISPDCAGLDKVRLHYDFPAVNCIICKEKKSISICFLKAVVEECCQEILFQLKYVTDSFWFFYPPLRAVMLLWLAARNHCCFSSSTWDALKGKSQPHIAILFFKKKSINVESVMPPECYPEAKPSRRKFLLNRMHCAVTWLFNTTIETMQRRIAGGHLNCFEYTCNQKWRGAAMLNICWSTKSMHFLDFIKKKDCEFRNTYVKESINPFPKQIFTLSLILVI